MGNPAVAVDDVRGPAQFLGGLQDAAGEENGPVAIVGKEITLFIVGHLFAAEVIFVVDEVHLHAGGRDGSHLDYEGMIHVGNDDIHTGKADNLVQLVLPLVDAAISRHERTDFLLPLLNTLRQVTANQRNGGFRKIGGYFRVHKQNSFN